MEILDESCSDIGPSFAEITPLSIFHAEWSNLQLGRDILDNSLRIEVAAHWTSTPPLPSFSGEYRIPAPMEILGQDASRLASMLSDDFHKKFVTQLRYFDNTYASGRGFAAYLRMNPESTRREIWFHDLVATETPPYPPGFTILDLTFNQYVEALTLTKGLYGWQYLFADISFQDPAIDHLAAGLRDGLEAFSELFTDQDYSSLLQRLEARL
ncbi:hypothetical protein [Streptomyces sp. NBC_01237]|uniref:hypothetical protein n=1 Tax=Streptomyces sp. NBC_01237 TaxID=2903790 RepID=UPI002DDAFD1A|nr:hypothetical protein [Streptomyces sp. NBC_01237]WRZ72482.1 hypothetical protein OG251_13055 [Streptomyces sp. NBC_01237]